VSESIKKKTLQNLDKRHNSVLRNKFDYPWVPDPYENLRASKNQQMAESKQKQQLISPKTFKLPGINKKLKYEDLSGETFSYIEDNFSNAYEHGNRIQWINNTKSINSAFKSPVKSRIPIGKGRINELINILNLKILKDWEKLSFSVVCNSDENIDIRVLDESIENKKALHSYMNVLQETDNDVQKFLLKKNMNRWGMNRGCYVYYSLIPPWVSFRTFSTSLSLYPHSSSISMSRTGKNFPGSVKSGLYGFSDTSPE
jgi:hypothetical protein